MFGSEAWVPVTSLGACDQSVCLEEYQLPVELDTKICLSFISCSSSVQHWESLGLFGLIVHGTARLPIYTTQILTHWFESVGSIAAAREMMGEGQAFPHQSTVVVFKGLVIPGYGGVSRIPLLHRYTLHVRTVVSNISMRHGNV